MGSLECIVGQIVDEKLKEKMKNLVVNNLTVTDKLTSNQNTIMPIPEPLKSYGKVKGDKLRIEDDRLVFKVINPASGLQYISCIEGEDEANVDITTILKVLESGVQVAAPFILKSNILKPVIDSPWGSFVRTITKSFFPTTFNASIDIPGLVVDSSLEFEIPDYIEPPFTGDDNLVVTRKWARDHISGGGGGWPPVGSELNLTSFSKFRSKHWTYTINTDFNDTLQYMDDSKTLSVLHGVNEVAKFTATEWIFNNIVKLANKITHSLGGVECFSTNVYGFAIEGETKAYPAVKIANNAAIIWEPCTDLEKNFDDDASLVTTRKWVRNNTFNIDIATATFPNWKTIIFEQPQLDVALHKVTLQSRLLEIYDDLVTGEPEKVVDIQGYKYTIGGTEYEIPSVHVHGGILLNVPDVFPDEFSEDSNLVATRKWVRNNAGGGGDLSGYVKKEDTNVDLKWGSFTYEGNKFGSIYGATTLYIKNTDNLGQFYFGCRRQDSTGEWVKGDGLNVIYGLKKNMIQFRLGTQGYLDEPPIICYGKPIFADIELYPGLNGPTGEKGNGIQTQKSTLGGNEYYSLVSQLPLIYDEPVALKNNFDGDDNVIATRQWARNNAGGDVSNCLKKSEIYGIQECVWKACSIVGTPSSIYSGYKMDSGFFADEARFWVGVWGPTLATGDNFMMPIHTELYDLHLGGTIPESKLKSKVWIDGDLKGYLFTLKSTGTDTGEVVGSVRTIKSANYYTIKSTAPILFDEPTALTVNYSGDDSLVATRRWTRTQISSMGPTISDNWLTINRTFAPTSDQSTAIHFIRMNNYKSSGELLSQGDICVSQLTNAAHRLTIRVNAGDGFTSTTTSSGIEFNNHPTDASKRSISAYTNGRGVNLINYNSIFSGTPDLEEDLHGLENTILPEPVRLVYRRKVVVSNDIPRIMEGMFLQYDDFTETPISYQLHNLDSRLIDRVRNDALDQFSAGRRKLNPLEKEKLQEYMKNVAGTLRSGDAQ